jgi:DNA invertase Pin-like site-specific DNA recombinase
MDDPRPSIFAQENGALLSMRQTEVVENARKEGRDIGHIPGVSTKVRVFHYYSRA